MSKLRFARAEEIAGLVCGRTIKGVHIERVQWEGEQQSDAEPNAIVFKFDDGSVLRIENDEAPFSLDVSTSDGPIIGTGTQHDTSRGEQGTHE